MRLWMNRRGLVLHAPFLQRLALDGLKDEVLDNEADNDDGQQAGEDSRDVEKVAVLEDEPAEAALSGRDAEDELGGDQRAPGESPADLEARQDRREGRRHKDADDIGKTGQ